VKIDVNLTVLLIFLYAMLILITTNRAGCYSPLCIAVKLMDNFILVAYTYGFLSFLEYGIDQGNDSNNYYDVSTLKYFISILKTYYLLWSFVPIYAFIVFRITSFFEVNVDMFNDVLWVSVVLVAHELRCFGVGDDSNEDIVKDIVGVKVLRVISSSSLVVLTVASVLNL
jgi:hypothetical protein